MPADSTLANINGVLLIGNTVIQLAQPAIAAIVAAVRGGHGSVDINISLPSAEAKFHTLIDVADEWERTHPKTD